MCNLSDMVCHDEGSTQCIVLNMMQSGPKRITLMIRPSNKVSQLIDDIKNQMQVENFDIAVQLSKHQEETLLKGDEDKTLSEIGIDFSSNKERTTIKLLPSNSKMQRRSAIVAEADSASYNSMQDEELPMGATADSPLHNKRVSIYASSSTRSSAGYVGLVNQAMTCYLNSLLQALFMTPEFRNALYNWTNDDSNDDASKNIPYQLQRLFVNLQTSSKLSVETTDLTRSFGWDSTEAWQQHDIQELCRVMFDTLEQKFKGTKQADFINRLYEGKMIDYVKCLECGTEKSREDTFLDIPLPVRPFGSSSAYGSIEEALKGFVEPETLDGNNQYHCETCEKKCNAHKGLKFSKFPYILTLHLKRFDFDYQTFLRIKLNDRVTFPQTLNLNSFIKDRETSDTFIRASNAISSTQINSDATSSEHGSVESAIKFDENSSATDSGSVLDEEVGAPSTSNTNHKSDLDPQDDDEGIDVTSGTEPKTILPNDPGQYVYELFSIMIHSGSASGGHYYAYIKEFENGEWFCFNDQSVSPLSKDDIEKSFGGSPGGRTFYSSSYSSSTNAYMLMYRQIDAQRNVAAIKCESFPEHIKQLQLTLKEETERKIRPNDYNLQKYKVYHFDQQSQQMSNVRVFLGSDSTIEEALENAYRRFKLQTIVPLSCCRLVAYDSNEENIVCSFDGKETEPLQDLLGDLSTSDLLLEVRDEGSRFDVCVPGDIETRVYTVDTNSSDIDGPTIIRVHKTATVQIFSEMICQKLKKQFANANDILLAGLKYSVTASLLSDRNKLCDENINHKSKIFVTLKSSSLDSKEFLKIVERSNHIISLYFTLPKTDKETLEKLLIPSYDTARATMTNLRQPDCGDVVDAVMNAPPIVQYIGDYKCIPNHLEPESNSEDSSLSDGDRTLVGDVSPILSTGNSPADEQLPKMNGDAHSDTDHSDTDQMKGYYFKATYYEEPALDDNTEEPIRTLKVLVHRHMNVVNLKRVLEPYIKVPMEYFKIFRYSSTQNEIECTRLSEDLRSFSDGERLTIELGRALRSGEYKCKVYHMKLLKDLDQNEPLTFVCDWILCNGASVIKTKHEILAQIANDPRYQSIQLDYCRLRKKSGLAPGKIFYDDQIFGDDIILITEIIVQELYEKVPKPIVEPGLVIFIRRWNPSDMTLGPFKEVTIFENDNIKEIFAKESGLPEENIEFAKVNQLNFFLNGTSPHQNISILDVQTSLLWNGNPTTCNDFPLSSAQDGAMFFYRDKTEELKQMTPAERQEIKNQDNARNGTGSYDRASRRRERALKIYVDSSPKKNDD